MWSVAHFASDKICTLDLAYKAFPRLTLILSSQSSGPILANATVIFCFVAFLKYFYLLVCLVLHSLLSPCFYSACFPWRTQATSYPHTQVNSYYHSILNYQFLPWGPPLIPYSNLGTSFCVPIALWIPLTWNLSCCILIVCIDTFLFH